MLVVGLELNLLLGSFTILERREALLLCEVDVGQWATVHGKKLGQAVTGEASLPGNTLPARSAEDILVMTSRAQNRET